MATKAVAACAVILLALHPASLMHKNPQIIHGLPPILRKRSID